MTIRSAPADAHLMTDDALCRRIQSDIVELAKRGHTQRKALASHLREEVSDLDLAIQSHERLHPIVQRQLARAPGGHA